jgi:HlyD family secretion protein
MSPLYAAYHGRAVNRALYVSLALMSIVGLLSACSRQDHNAYQGYVEGEFVYLASSQSGQLAELPVTRGQTIKSGAPLFALESTDEYAALQQAQQQLAAARAQLADIQTGKRPPEIDVDRAQLAQAQANARKAALQLARAASRSRNSTIHEPTPTRPPRKFANSRARCRLRASPAVRSRSRRRPRRLQRHRQQLFRRNGSSTRSA